MEKIFPCGCIIPNSCFGFDSGRQILKKLGLISLIQLVHHLLNLF